MLEVNKGVIVTKGMLFYQLEQRRRDLEGWKPKVCSNDELYLKS